MSSSAAIPSMLLDHVHSGPRQAGFKSLLAFNAEKGVAGYTGYLPSGANIPIIPKGSTLRTGKLSDLKTKDQLILATDTAHTKTEAMRQYSAQPGDFKVPGKEGGGYWIAVRKIAPGSTLCGDTTYEKELGNAEAQTRLQLQRTMGLPCTMSHNEQARRCHAEGTLFGSGPVTSHGDPLGYTTAYGSMICKQPMTCGSAAAGAPRVPSMVPEARHAKLPHTMLPRLDGASSYSKHYGTYGSDPMARTARTESEMSMMATTNELSEGTARNTHHIPGYTGFTPAAPYNLKANAQAMGQQTRRDAKADMLLFSLDHFSRSRLPKYTGFKPQDASNATSEQPSMGPTKQTASGLAAHQATMWGLDNRDKSKALDSNKGIMAMFTGGGEFISDNGVSDAQQFYDRVRPLEGRPRQAFASKATAYGKKFNDSNSLV